MFLQEITQKGHFTKAFDPSKKIPDETFGILIDFLYSMASSVNAQPTRYLVTTDQEVKNRIADVVFSDNTPKVRNASHVIIACTLADLPAEYLDRITEQETSDDRFSTPEWKQRWMHVVRFWIDFHRNDVKDLLHWSEKQTYFAVGGFVTAAAALGVNVAPLEGFDSRVLDPVFGLREKGLTASLVLCLGYRDVPNDWAVHLKKSRLPREEIFTTI